VPTCGMTEAAIGSGSRGGRSTRIGIYTVSLTPCFKLAFSEARRVQKPNSRAKSSAQEKMKPSLLSDTPQEDHRVNQHQHCGHGKDERGIVADDEEQDPHWN
jgi:hypothetical protein